MTDDYAAYKNLFSEHQLCWAHLIRKAIKLVLQNPDETEYAEFLDQLCGIYHDAKDLRDNVAASVVGDPLNDASERKAVVAKLQDRTRSLCSGRIEKIITSKAAAKSEPPIEPTPSHVETFILLQRELADNVECLFVFVEHPAVEPTNNRSERNARREAAIPNSALPVAIAKAYAWQEQLESGQFEGLEDIAKEQGIDRSYVGRMLQLTSLAPDIVESILAGQTFANISLRHCRKGIPVSWDEQRRSMIPDRLGLSVTEAFL